MINLIAAIDLNNALGFQNKLLVKLPEDMKHFRQLTENNIVVFGRKTYESIGKPLKQRQNIILTRNQDYKAPIGTFVYNTLNEVLHKYSNQSNGDRELFIAGGEEIYRQALPFAKKIYLTIIENHFKQADAFFPKLSDEWRIVSRESHDPDDKHRYPYHFLVYERK
ncbi:dihydrofolate reductase [Metabacillus fastidiosus]|uniref:dihydrofolate reductase n=1 Tax=Metabacillus fastidiosus TaxID=1458 RepID=UPI003D268100